MSETPLEPWSQPRTRYPRTHRRRFVRWIDLMAGVSAGQDWAIRCTAQMSRCLITADAAVRRRFA